MRTAWVLVALSAAGCDSLFDLDLVRPIDAAAIDPDGASPDAANDDAPDDAPPDAEVFPSTQCALSFGGTRYAVVSIPTGYSYDLARSYCASLQVAMSPRYSHLAVIGSLIERKLLEQKLSATDRGWIGLTNDNTGWRWDSTETVQTITWATNEPDGTGTCGQLISGVGIDDQNCAQQLTAFICECDQYMGMP